MDTPVDLAAPNNDQTFEFQAGKSCKLTASYFYDYEGFQSNWQHVVGFFSLKRKGMNISVKVSCYQHYGICITLASVIFILHIHFCIRYSMCRVYMKVVCNNI